MTSSIKKIFIILLSLVPLLLITGPAAPDIVISLSVIVGLFWLIFIERDLLLVNNNFIRASFIFWAILIITSFYSINKERSFQDSIIFLRYLLIPITIYFLFFKNNKNLRNVLLIIFILVIFVSLDTMYQFFNYTSKDGFGEDIFGF